MGLFDGSFYDPLSAGGILGAQMPGGNFNYGSRAEQLNDILQRVLAGLNRGSGQQDFGAGVPPMPQLSLPQAMPQSVSNTVLGATGNQPAAPSLPQAVNIPQLKIAEAQQQEALLPPNAMPTASIGQPQVAQAPPPPPPQASFLDRMAAGADNFANAPSILGGIAHAAKGYSTGQRIDSQFKTLSDFLGNQTPYWVNPIGGTIQEAQIGSTGAAPSGGLGIDTAGLQRSMTMPQQVNPQTGRDENFISSLGPVLGAQVVSALNGDSKLDGRMLQRIQPLAARAEPGWTQQTYQQRMGAYKSFYGGGKDQETARALNQSAGHFAELVDKMASLPGSQMPLFNWAANTYNTQVRGKGEANNFLINAHAVAAELSRLFKQVNMSDTEIKKWEEGLSPNMSVEQQRGMARTLLGLYQEAFDALEKKRVDGLGPALAAKAPPLIGAHTAGNLKKVETYGIGGQLAPTGGLPQGWTVTVR